MPPGTGKASTLYDLIELSYPQTGIDEQAVWEWGFVERASSGLYMIRHGAPGEGRDYLAAAARLSEP